MLRRWERDVSYSSTTLWRSPLGRGSCLQWMLRVVGRPSDNGSSPCVEFSVFIWRFLYASRRRQLHGCWRRRRRDCYKNVWIKTLKHRSVAKLLKTSVKVAPKVFILCTKRWTGGQTRFNKIKIKQSFLKSYISLVFFYDGLHMVWVILKHLMLQRKRSD